MKPEDCEEAKSGMVTAAITLIAGLIFWAGMAVGIVILVMKFLQ